MPMNRDLYPGNWDDIAREIKEKSGWTCEECGRPCRPTGITWAQFCLSDPRLDEHWYCQTYELREVKPGEVVTVEKRQRFTLTVAHLNHDPGDCRVENLKALCAPCHCRYDSTTIARAIKRRLKLSRCGQSELFTASLGQ